MKILIILFTVITTLRLTAHAPAPHDLRVVVRDAETHDPIRGATVRVGTRGAVTDRSGAVVLHGMPDTSVVITRMIGYGERRDTLVLTAVLTSVNVDLVSRAVTTQDVTVTASRHEQSREESPVIVTVSDQQVFRAAQAVSLSEGLSYQPGLRLENNCQNCGFTQVRLNGMQGPYTQILVDSRPVFSALNGVYGLEQIPASMVDRIEVIRGAGSAMYGAGAIAGTVNIITRDPLTTSASVSSTTSWINARTPDATINARGTWVSDDLNTGLTLFGLTRTRVPFDVNGDGYSEVPKLWNASGGGRFVYQASEQDRFSAEGHWIREFRRGGDHFDLVPHEADIAEQLDHAIGGGAVSYEHAFSGDRQRIAGYASMQSTIRYSYYGGTGGDPAAAERAKLYYGTTNDIIGVGGVQFTSQEWQPFGIQSVLSTGLEIAGNHVVDEMPGYGRSIDQQTLSTGLYAQLQLSPASPLSIALGARFDALDISGTYQFDPSSFEQQDRTFYVVNPRISIIGKLAPGLQLRTSYASGFRGPQAFDEDLHVSTLQGSARLIRIDPSLRPERSHSISMSLDGNSASPTSAVGFTLDGFATLLQAPFVTSLTPDTVPGSSASIALKTNGDAAWVAGINAEARIAFSKQMEATAAITVQDARYVTAQVLAQGADGSYVSSPYITRTPNVYGSITSSFFPTDEFTIDVSAIVTGPMHVINERTITMHRTPWFCDAALQLGYDLHLNDLVELTIAAGVVNVFNAYQSDLESGPLRDASYIYGPLRPRTITLSMSLAWQ
ncbi:MAG: TonB-dependent receptor [Ignavibacteria bacterium]|nr:TonB-dependent receptor [Ignavibacteria bacterium]MBK6418883.1 TonB-dependent receptor [Ignavibacteria bacterium]MBK6760423.1 TonB-dependent receptor [Ignavibacteria bacterium]MBK7033820.1 TonB-dependent receptor [Ignavibacteria bacterium]MBK7411789.1 TonB-dependent receptor [Ignavibacteria bacterium]